MIKTLKLSSITDSLIKKSTIAQCKEIFYLSSSLKEFSSLERKEAFYKRWSGDYVSFYPEYFYVMIEDDVVLGYLSGCVDSQVSLLHLEVPGLAVFKDLFVKYPAHLHINFHPNCRGRGLGSQLINEYCSDLLNLNIQGVHLVTSPGAANISFYQRLGFSYEEVRDFNQMDLLFMGKELI